ncbi:hypothetical protein MMC13_005033 [Lambiella insularis]|nr:hypothetical protein [Lambiella insularis]
MDLTARSFDLAEALVDFSNASSMTDVSVSIIRWLARERIDDASFTSCCKLAASLAYPNTKVLEIRTSLQEADKKISNMTKAPIRLVVSGSLGRPLGYDPEFCYMVSSVATLTEFHEPQHVADILCSMVLDNGGHRESVSYRYNVQRAPIKAVISKIVERLPPEFDNLHVHLLDSNTFAGIIMGIQRTEKDIFIVSDPFAGDLTAWLLCHFEGTFQVVVKRTTIFKRQIDTSSRLLKMVVQKPCPSDLSCLDIDASIEVSESVGQDTFTFLRGTDDNTFRPCSYTRQSLYSTSNLMSTPHAYKSIGPDEAQENHIAAVTKTMIE